jgi:hypothetical protein
MRSFLWYDQVFIFGRLEQDILIWKSVGGLTQADPGDFPMMVGMLTDLTRTRLDVFVEEENPDVQVGKTNQKSVQCCRLNQVISSENRSLIRLDSVSIG